MHPKSRTGTTKDAALLFRLDGIGSSSTAGGGMRSPIGKIANPRNASPKICSKLRNGRSLGRESSKDRKALRREVSI